ncbi:hypothetical protein GGX14DRAFT_395676 [Mycena pura]|uniref:G domain-containing protein n=1 Tax=Mycena pura TaxID=153505 RepID=A0AAD6YC59_9AGAR|nr:hypothetical protein GGX14DRAFT_395676 [Mycena pura]
MSDEEIKEYCANRAETMFKELCVEPLRDINRQLTYARSGGLSNGRYAQPDRKSLTNLAQLSQDLVQKKVTDAWVIHMMAQRASANVKINGSIGVGTNHYWQGLASSSKFTGRKLKECLDTVHQEIVEVWNFYDPQAMLTDRDILRRLREIVHVLISPRDDDDTTAFERFQSLIEQNYNPTAVTLRCFMGYIIGLMVIMDKLFQALLERPPPRKVTHNDIDEALEAYEKSCAGAVHSDVREYVRTLNFGRDLRSEPGKRDLLGYNLDRSSQKTTHSGPQKRAIDIDNSSPALAGWLQVRMAAEYPPPATDEILKACPRLRVLVVGNTGVGKSSLISHAFGIPVDVNIRSGPSSVSISPREQGQCKIDDEIMAPENPLFVLHDSMGFVPGDENNYQLVEQFLQDRNASERQLADRVHIIWLCILIPHAGSRVIETGEKKLLALATRLKGATVPLVAVFTQFDLLVSSVEIEKSVASENATDEEIENLSREIFQEKCIAPLNEAAAELKYKHINYAWTSGLSDAEHTKPDRESLANLIQITRNLVGEQFEGDAWIVSAMAQRASAQHWNEKYIFVQYWLGLASATNFAGFTLDTCLKTVHKEMTDSWNFYDPKDLLHSPEFVDRIRVLTQLVTVDEGKAKSWLSTDKDNNTQTILAVILGASVAAALGPIIAGIGLAGWFVEFIASVYRNTPETLRCFMGYIIDLTLILDQLFLVVLSRKLPRILTKEDIDLAFESYENSDLGRVHHDIRQFVASVNFKEILKPELAGEKVKELIRHYSSSRPADLKSPEGDGQAKTQREQFGDGSRAQTAGSKLGTGCSELGSKMEAGSKKESPETLRHPGLNTQNA